MVDVCDTEGRWLATGHFQADESIMVKVLSFDTRVIDEDFWRERIGSALDYRRTLGLWNPTTPAEAGSAVATDNNQPSITNVCRLVHGEGDGLPGLVADFYDGVLVLQCHSVGMHRELPTLVPVFRKMMGERLVSVFDKSSATLPESHAVEDAFIYGPDFSQREVVENGCRMLIDIYDGQKTGFFIDQRENRAMLRDLAGGKRVLNCFGYTGGFSVSALKGGASCVETVDISKKAIEMCGRNIELNFGREVAHRGVVADVLKYLDTDRASDFDIVVLDPPAFAKNHRSLQQGLKGYRTINRKAMEHIRRGGLLFTFSCSQAVSQADFQTMVFTAANQAHREVRIVRRLTQGADHPVSIYHPEGEYLKGLLLQVE